MAHVGGGVENRCGGLRAPFRPVGVERRPQRRVVVGEQGDGEQPGVRRPGVADGERGDRDAGGHLDDRQQRVLAVQVARRHGHAEHRHGGLRRQHPGQVGGPAGPGDDRLHAAIGCRFGEGEHLVGHAMGADDPRLVGDAEALEDLDGLVHRRPVARRAHHDGDERLAVDVAGDRAIAVTSDRDAAVPHRCAELAAMQRNVLGGELIPCSLDPLTGFYRTGCCENHGDDPGMHVVCCRVTAEFLEFEAANGNDLSTPAPEFGFAGLVPGDQWCVCAARWAEALASGVGVPGRARVDARLGARVRQPRRPPRPRRRRVSDPPLSARRAGASS